MFSVESLGNLDQEKISNYDQEQIQWLQRSITFNNVSYHIQFDKLAQVPSNLTIALSILDHLVRGLEKKGMYQEYLDVFLQYEKESIMEEIFVPSRRFGDYVWIPHWPIFKSDSAATSRIRPVFNFSLKTGNSVSLNEAAYSSVNLLSDMLKLLLSFRIKELSRWLISEKHFWWFVLAWRLTGTGFVFSLGMVTGFIVSDKLHSFLDSLPAILYMGVFWNFTWFGIPKMNVKQ